MSAFKKLTNAYAIETGDRLCIGAGGYPVGAVASVLPDEETGKKFIGEYGEDIESLGFGDPHLVKVGDPWDFMRRAAGEGIAGIGGSELFPERFMFMVRVEEAGADFPTVLSVITDDGWGPSLTRFGEKQLSHAEVLHWQRYDILDKVSGFWGQACPFRDWEHGDTLYEIRSEHAIAVLAHVPILGNWNSTEGSFAFFTEEEGAHHYLNDHLGDGQNRMITIDPLAPDDPNELMSGLRPEPVSDLNSRLSELKEIRPFAAWCINPDDHRENTGYGRLIYGGDHPASLREGGTSMMVAVSGHWLLEEGNKFQLQEAYAPWTGMDTIRWSGSHSIQLIPIEKSFSNNTTQDHQLESLTEAEAEEYIDRLFESDPDSEQEDSGSIDSGIEEQEAIDQFHMVAWDTVTGEGGDNSWSCSDFLAALKCISDYEKYHDREHRITGASSCTHLGFAGTFDDGSENLRSQRFQNGIRKIAFRVLRQGYRPSDAKDLVALCNGTLKTLQMNFCGYAKDLLWASAEDQQEFLLGLFEIKTSHWLDWFGSVEVDTDSAGTALGIDRVGAKIWSQLSPKSRLFISTALKTLEFLGSSRYVDYAPVSLEVVKALEVELASVLSQFIKHIANTKPKFDEKNHAEKSLIDFLDGGKAPTLGTIGFLLRPPSSGASELIQKFHQFLSTLPNGGFLTSKAFSKKGLSRVIHKYRNGGVHDSAVTEDVCIECVNTIIGDSVDLGYLAQIVLPRQAD